VIQEGGMDMTPLVDVTFLLLIFFMVTAAFTLQRSIEVPRPEQTAERSLNYEDLEDPDDPIVVIVDQFSTFRVRTAASEEEAPSKHELLRKLRRARNSAPAYAPPRRLLIKAHGDALHERVVMALDAGAEVGMEQMQIITVEEDL
jgi:biopolymer transport protein ExbD